MKFTIFPLLPLFIIGVSMPVFANPKFEAMLDDLLDGSVPQISTDVLAAELKTGKQPPVLLDTRPEEEYAVSHISGARRVGFSDFSLDRLAGFDKSAPLIVYCSVGKRSELIGGKLLAAGFTNVRNLRGGLFQWANDGRPLVNSGGATQTVHSYNRKWSQWLDTRVPSVR